jgi:DNA-binding response OmpR family regulator
VTRKSSVVAIKTRLEAKENARVAAQIRTLVVDDEKGIRFVLEETLRRDGHAVMTAASGEEALERLRENPFDLAVVDLKLGGRVDGLRVLEAIRWRWPQTAVVILTAHASLDSALAAIREGVDGYLLKPVHPDEVREAAQEALERRRGLAVPAGMPQAQEAEEILEHGPFALDLRKYLATLENEPLDLTPQEFDLLAYLVRNAHRVTSPKELVRVVRDYEPEDTNEARDIIKWYIHRLRQKVEPDPSEPRYILNVRGVGYIFEG